jgi:hypothetical protein
MPVHAYCSVPARSSRRWRSCPSRRAAAPSTLPMPGRFGVPFAGKQSAHEPGRAGDPPGGRRAAAAPSVRVRLRRDQEVRRRQRRRARLEPGSFRVRVGVPATAYPGDSAGPGRGQLPRPTGPGAGRGEQPVPGDRRHARRPDHRHAPVQRDQPGRRPADLGLGRDRPGAGRAVHHGAGVEPARAGPARLPAQAGPVRGVPRCARGGPGHQRAARRAGHLRPPGLGFPYPRPGPRRARQRGAVPSQFPGAHAQGYPGQEPGGRGRCRGDRLDRAAGPGRLRRPPRPAHRVGVWDLRHSAYPGRLDLSGCPGHGVRR